MGNTRYDLTVAYRIYPRVSKVPLVFANDKYQLSKLCLESFKASLGSLRAKIIVLLDNCPDEYEILFRSVFEDEDLDLVKLPGAGNHATFELQVKLLSEQEYSDIVYFAEDDYLYLDGQFESMVDFLKSHQDVDFVSPYDHLDYYTLDFHNHGSFIRTSNGKHWRTANSTCLTFLTTKNTLQASKATLMTFVKDNYDASLWIALTKYRVFNLAKIFQYFFNNRFLFQVIKKSWFFCWYQILFGKRYTLWVPIVSVGTHIEKDFLAPNVDWLGLIDRQVKLSSADQAINSFN